MARQPRKRRYTATPSRAEVNVRAIPVLPQDGWRLYDLDEFPTVGTVPKNYLAYGDPNSARTVAYFAKKGRTGADARECVTEEIISKIGAMLPLEMASSKLVRLSRTDVRFLSSNFVVRGCYELLHGIEVAALYFGAQPSDVENTFNLKEKAAERSFYNINNIVTILDSVYPTESVELKKGFFKMIAFDAFIGAPDRHAMNWGVLSPLVKPSEPVRYAPIFDTARGLFREIADADLLKKECQQGRERFLESYANRSRPIFSTGEASFSTGEASQPNHFSLVRWIVANRQDPDREAMYTVFDAVDIPAIEHMLQRRFRRIITQERIAFIRDLLSHRINRLREECRT